MWSGCLDKKRLVNTSLPALRRHAGAAPFHLLEVDAGAHVAQEEGTSSGLSLLSAGLCEVAPRLASELPREAVMSVPVAIMSTVAAMRSCDEVAGAQRQSVPAPFLQGSCRYRIFNAADSEAERKAETASV